MALTREECETIIRWDKSGDKAIVYTFDVALMNKLKKQGAKVIREGKYETSPWAEFEVAKRWVKVRKPTVRNDLIGKGVQRKDDNGEG